MSKKNNKKQLIGYHNDLILACDQINRLEDKINRIETFIKNIKFGDQILSQKFVEDGVLAIINDDAHLEFLDFRKLTEQEVDTAKNVAEMVGWENE